MNNFAGAGLLAVFFAVVPPSTEAASAPSPSLAAKLASCDQSVVSAAVNELLQDPKTLEEPLLLFHGASAERMAGRTEQAAFLYLAARLRTARQILFVQGDRAQLLTIMEMTVGALIMPAIVGNADVAQRVVHRVIKWDRVTPDPFRDSEAAKTGAMPAKLAEINAALERMPDQVRAQADRRDELKAAAHNAEVQVKAMNAKRCGPGTLDSIEAEAIRTRIKRESETLVKTHPAIIQRAGAPIKSTSVGSYLQGPSGLPTRLTVVVTPLNQKSFFAEVDAEVTITADRKIGSLRLRPVCLTDLWVGQRDSSWKDVCQGDPKAIRLN